MLKKILNTPFSVPSEGEYLELGCLNIETILKARRINYLHYLLNQDNKSLLYNLFSTQWKYSCRNDWTRQVRLDLTNFGISEDLEEIKKTSKYRFKRLVKKKSKEFALFTFLERKTL